MPRRPASSAPLAVVKPVPSSPSSRSPSTRTPSKATCAVREPAKPILCSGAATASPSLAAGTRKVLMPSPDRPPSGTGLVRAKTV